MVVNKNEIIERKVVTIYNNTMAKLMHKAQAQPHTQKVLKHVRCTKKKKEKEKKEKKKEKKEKRKSEKKRKKKKKKSGKIKRKKRMELSIGK